MSKELEMLREMVAQSGDWITVGYTDLKAILARLEAAELVCENWIEWDDKMAAYASGEADSGAVDDAALSTSNALRAYRDLDAEKEKP